MNLGIHGGKSRQVSWRNLRVAPSGVPFDPQKDSIEVVNGDWDLNTVSVDENIVSLVDTHKSATSPANSRPVPVAVGRDGDAVISPEWLRSMPVRPGVGEGIAVRVIGRHPEWQRFRDEILDYVSAEEDKLAYAPLTHFDLVDISSWNGPDRFEAIAQCIFPDSHTVLDIGAHWGYMCEQLEKNGRHCVAVEVDSRSHYFMTRLRRAGRYLYEAVQDDIFEFVKKRNHFDMVLSLAVFHHFIKTERNHARLEVLLDCLKMNEMFFWAHNPQEGQMQGAFCNYQPDDFARFIVERSCLSHFEPISVIEYRTLYHLWR